MGQERPGLSVKNRAATRAFARIASVPTKVSCVIVITVIGDIEGVMVTGQIVLANGF